MNIAYIASAFLACIALAAGGSLLDIATAILVAVVCVVDQAKLWPVAREAWEAWDRG